MGADNACFATAHFRLRDCPDRERERKKEKEKGSIIFCWPCPGGEWPKYKSDNY